MLSEWKLSFRSGVREAEFRNEKKVDFYSTKLS